MKNPLRWLLPLFIVALLVTVSVGIAFAREINLVGKLTSDSRQSSSSKTSALIKATLADQPIVAKPSSSDQPVTGSISLTYTDTFTHELEITGTVEVIMTDTWTVSGQAFAVTPETEIEDHIVVGDKVKVELFTSSANVLTASQIELLDEHKEGVTTEFTGTVEALSTLSITVSGKVLAITPETEIEGNVVVGAKVKVEALVNPDGSLIAKQIELLENDDEEGENHQGNCDEDECENHQGGDDNHQGQCQEEHCGGNDPGEHDGDQESHLGSHHDGGNDFEDHGGSYPTYPGGHHDGGGD